MELKTRSIMGKKEAGWTVRVSENSFLVLSGPSWGPSLPSKTGGVSHSIVKWVMDD